MTETSAENAAHGEEDDKEEWVHFYGPVVEPQAAIAESTTEHTDTQEYNDKETPVLGTDEPLEATRASTNTNDLLRYSKRMCC